MAALRRIVLLVRDVPAAARFYTDGLGLQVAAMSDDWAQLLPGGAAAPPLVLRRADGGEAQLTAGYTPMLQFDVTDMDALVPRLLALGAHLDGRIQYGPHGKVAALRSPDGHMIGVVEPAEAAAATPGARGGSAGIMR
jgi:catechol 2,3-dioxygenase-like lactoylglutathione lyase family enzyme